MKRPVYILMLFFCLTIDLSAQWERVTTVPFGGNDYSLAVSGNTIYHGTFFGLFRSLDSGSTWSTINFGAVDSCVKTIIIVGNFIYLGTPAEGVFVSGDAGLTWEARNNGLTNLAIHCFTFAGSSLFAATDGGVFVSDDEGTSWASVNTGITNPEIRTITNLGGVFFAGSYGSGVYCSNNNGQTWIVKNNGLGSWYITHLFTYGTIIFAGTNGGMYKSTDNGNTWENANLGVSQEVLCSISDNGFLYIGTNGSGVYYSSDNGDTWTGWNDGFQNQNVYCLGVCGDEIFSGLCCGFGLWKREQLSVGIYKKNHSDNLLIFPTPAIDMLYYSYSGNNSLEYTLILVNLSGEVVLSEKRKFATGKSTGSVNVNKLKQGEYLFIIEDQRNNILAEEKVIISR